jgi:phosphoribosylformylglycinamidine cyclo-ligase
VADELLRPSVVYAPLVRRVVRAAEKGPPLLHAVAHVTGGGIAGNLSRVLPSSCDAVVDRGAWDEPRVFTEIRRVGNVDDAEMARVFNLGVGMVLVVPPAALDTVLEVLDAPAASDRPVLIGTVVEGSGHVRMEGR